MSNSKGNPDICVRTMEARSKGYLVDKGTNHMPTEEEIQVELRRIREEGFVNHDGTFIRPWTEKERKVRAGALECSPLEVVEVRGGRN